MPDLRILAVGQKMPTWVQAGCDTYLPRFRRQCRVLLEEIPASRREGAEAQTEHGQRLLDRLKRDDWLVLLDERGEQWSTVSFFYRPLVRNIVCLPTFPGRTNRILASV